MIGDKAIELLNDRVTFGAAAAPENAGQAR